MQNIIKFPDLDLEQDNYFKDLKIISFHTKSFVLNVKAVFFFQTEICNSCRGQVNTKKYTKNKSALYRSDRLDKSFVFHQEFRF